VIIGPLPKAKKRKNGNAPKNPRKQANLQKLPFLACTDLACTLYDLDPNLQGFQKWLMAPCDTFKVLIHDAGDKPFHHYKKDRFTLATSLLQAVKVLLHCAGSFQQSM
jgi:hypothetical protein